MKKRIALLLCICLIVFAPLSALAMYGEGDRAAIFNPDLDGAYGVVRMDDGTLRAVGEKDFDDTRGWKNIKELYFNGLCVIGLTNEGKVCLSETDGLIKGYRMTDALKWKKIIELDWFGVHLFGLDANGTLHVTGGDDFNRSTIGLNKADGSKNVVQFAVCQTAVFTLHTDGTVKRHGKDTDDYAAVDGWTDIVQIVCTDRNVFGLRSDGTVLQSGWFEYPFVAGWTDVSQIVADGLTGIAAIKNDGSIVAENSYKEITGAEEWRDVQKLIAGGTALYAIGPDGGLLTSYGPYHGEEWHDLVDIWLDYDDIAGLRADGVVLYCGEVLETREIP